MKTKTTILFVIILGITAGNAQTYQWAKNMGGASWDYGYSIAVDGSNNVYTTGTFDGTADFDPGAGTSNSTSAGGDDIFISKLDAEGNFVWAKSMGGSDADCGLSIMVDDNGNVLTTGFFSQSCDFDPGEGTSTLTSEGDRDIFISKLDAAGNFLWAKSVGGTDDDWGNYSAVNGTGDIYITGSFRGTVDFDPGMGTSNLTSGTYSDIFVLKLDASGNFLWAKNMGGNLYDEGISIAVDDADNIYIMGRFEGTADFDPDAGSSTLTSAGSEDIFISKLNSAGNLLWAKRVGGSYSDLCSSFAIDNSGSIFTIGWFFGTVDFDPGSGTSSLTSNGDRDIFISKLDNNGNFLWAKSMGGAFDDYGFSINLDASGNIYTSGHFYETADFDPGLVTSNLTSQGYWDIFISKLDATGNYLWAKSMGGTNYEFCYSATLDDSGNLYTTGTFDGTVDFDPGLGTSNVISTGSSDVFISKVQATVVDIEEYIFANSLVVYPNPTSGVLNIESSTSYDDISVIIRNVTGQEILQKSYIRSNSLQFNLPGEAGIYLVEVSAGDIRATLKVLKE